MSDKQNEPYYDYIGKVASEGFSFDRERLRGLAERKFTGKIIIDFGEIVINFFEGGVTNMNKNFEPEIRVEESVKLRV